MSTTQERVEQQVGIEEPVGGPSEQHRSLRQDVWRQFKRHKGAVVGLIILAVIVFATVFGPYLYPLDPYAIDTSIANAPPSLDHVLGTDNLGRDVLARVLIGGRISLAVGFAAMFFGLVLGTTVGVISGFFRRLDGPLMRVTDLFLALPILPLLLVIIMLFRESLKNTFGEELARGDSRISGAISVRGIAFPLTLALSPGERGLVSSPHEAPSSHSYLPRRR
jgi:peptide/nickel transport system permease protein